MKALWEDELLREKFGGKNIITRDIDKLLACGSVPGQIEKFRNNVLDFIEERLDDLRRRKRVKQIDGFFDINKYNFRTKSVYVEA